MAEEKNYTLRSLKADDIFLAVRVINKIGIKGLKDCFNTPEVMKAITGAEKEQDADVSAVGMTVMLEIAGLILEHVPDCRNEIYALLSALSGMTQAEIAELPSGVFIQMVMDVIKKEEFRDFFQGVFGLPK